MKNKMTSKAALFIFIIGLFFILSYGYQNSFGLNTIKALETQNNPSSTYIGSLNIEKPLEKAKDIVDTLSKFRNDPKIKGLIIHIDCHGGFFGTTQTIVNEIKKFKKTKPVIVVIENYCYSCAYYIAAASDFIFAQPSSDVGGIGITSFIKKYKDLRFNENQVTGNMETLVIKTGKYKDPGHCYTPFDNENIEYIKQKAKKKYDQFIFDVAESRGLSLEDEKIWADGKEFVGTEALELGLIDALGGFTDALEKMKELLGQRGIKVESNLEINEE